MKTAIVADCLQQDVRTLNAPKCMIFQNSDTTPKQLCIITHLDTAPLIRL
jgi:hypothetical protein